MTANTETIAMADYLLTCWQQLDANNGLDDNLDLPKQTLLTIWFSESAFVYHFILLVCGSALLEPFVPALP